MMNRRMFKAGLLFLVTPLTLMAETKIEKIDFRGWPNSYRLSNGTIELIATSDVGPRIIHLGFVGAKNLFRIYDQFAGKTGGNNWINYGGHRLWHSPEDKVRTYMPDNSAVRVEQITNGLRLTPPVEAGTGIQKIMEVTLNPSRPEVVVVHRLQNKSVWPIELAAWALSVMEKGGFAIVPLPTRRHPDLLLPNRSLTLWPYTDMRDERFSWGRDHILVKQLAGKDRLKIGAYNNEQWLAYYLEPYLFVKRFKFVEGAPYPDFNASVEVFTNSDMLETETVSPLKVLQPGEELVHEERWELHKDLKLSFSEDDVSSKVLPLVRK